MRCGAWGRRRPRGCASTGINTLADVRARSLDDLRGLVGSLAEWLMALAHGRDDRPVEPNRPSKSSGSECTYAQDLTRLADVRREMDEMARDAAAWLERKRAVRADRGAQGALRRLHDHHAQPQHAGCDPQCRRDCGARAGPDRSTEAGRRPVRLLGVSVHGFSESPQPTAAREPDATATLPFD